MNQSMGQIAYEAVQQFLASNASRADGYSPPDEAPEGSGEWESMPPVYREAWEAGAQAVLKEYDSQHVVDNRRGIALVLGDDE